MVTDIASISYFVIHARPNRHALLFLALLVFILFTASCTKKPLSPSDGPNVLNKEDLIYRGLIKEADRAWRDKNTDHSEILYRQILNQFDLPSQEKTQAWERYTLSLMTNGRVTEVKAALNKWQLTTPEGRNDKSWQNAALQAVQIICDPQTRLVELSRLSDDPGMPFRLRNAAGMALMLEYSKVQDDQRIMDLLYALHAAATNIGPQAIADLEAAFFTSIQTSKPDMLNGLEALVPIDQQNSFPFTVLKLERAHRLAMKQISWMEAIQQLDRLRGQLINKNLVNSIIDQPIADIDPTATGIALILPLSGKISDIGWKIVRGAGVAQKELVQDGQNIIMKLINTESPDWQDKLRNLPKYFTLAGGPLLIDTIKTIQSAGMLSQCAFFAFLSDLGTIQEGQQAWRFFFSPEDQVHAVLNFGARELHIKKIVILHPAENFGRRMAELFKNEAQRQYIEIQSIYTYSPTDTQTWYDLVGQLTKNSDFDAVFLPGDWTHAEMLVPNFLYHKKERTIILGTALWSQTLARKSYIVERDFRWTIFPGAWWAANTAPAVEGLKQGLAATGQVQPDFWTALGYDFTRFAARIGQLPEGWDHTTIISRLLHAQNIDWSMAPIIYDKDGIAHQNLYIFKPNMDGFTPASAQELLIQTSLESRS
ncbi:conserved hypothetical protein [Desulfovibrionales bacterium]